MKTYNLALILISCIVTINVFAHANATYPLFIEEIEQMAQSQPQLRRHVRVFLSSAMTTVELDKWSKKYKMDVLSVSGSVNEGEYSLTSSIENVDAYEGSLKEILSSFVRTEQRRGVQSMQNSSLQSANEKGLNDQQRSYRLGYAKFLSSINNGPMGWKKIELLTSYRLLSKMTKDIAVERIILLSDKFTQVYEKLKREGKIKKRSLKWMQRMASPPKKGTRLATLTHLI
jgi:hypothetical protein